MGATSLQSEMLYDGLGNVVTTRDSNGTTTTYAYDKLGRRTGTTNALGQTTSTAYTAFGEVSSVTNARGGTSGYTYSRTGQLTSTRDAEGYVTNYSYNTFNELTAQTRFYNRLNPTLVANPDKDQTTLYEYDKLGRLTKVTDALGNFEQYTLNAFGQRTAVRNKLGGITTNTYDRRGQLVTETLPISSTRADGSIQSSTVVNSFEYDSRGNRTKMVEASGLTEARTTVFQYDNGNRLIAKISDSQPIVATSTSVIANSSPTETYVYDRRGNLIETKDAVGARTLMWYDGYDRVSHTLSPLGTLTRNIYDVDGNLTEKQVFASLVALPATAGGLPPTPVNVSNYRTTQYVYDALNRVIEMRVPNILTASFSGTLTSTTQSLVTKYEYDAVGNLVKTTDPNGRFTHSYYDQLGRKTSQADQGNYRTDYTYDTNGNVLNETRYFNKPADPNTSAPPAVVLDATNDRVTQFSYDKMGRRLTLTRLNVPVHNGTGGLFYQIRRLPMPITALAKSSPRPRQQAS
jgi:YD repeat-containing protein